MIKFHIEFHAYKKAAWSGAVKFRWNLTKIHNMKGESMKKMHT